MFYLLPCRRYREMKHLLMAQQPRKSTLIIDGRSRTSGIGRYTCHCAPSAHRLSVRSHWYSLSHSLHCCFFPPHLKGIFLQFPECLTSAPTFMVCVQHACTQHHSFHVWTSITTHNVLYCPIRHTFARIELAPGSRVTRAGHRGLQKTDAGNRQPGDMNMSRLRRW